MATITKIANDNNNTILNNTTTTTTTSNTPIDSLVDLDTTNTDYINKYIEKQVHKVLNMDQNTSFIFPNNLDDIMSDAVSIWNVLGLTEEEYNKKFFDNK